MGVPEVLPCFDKPKVPLAANSAWTRRDDLGEHLFAVVRRIIFLKDSGLTTQGVVASFLWDHIALLQRRSHPAWEYTQKTC